MGAVDDQPQLKSARLERYLACVPGGLAGYPAALTRGALFRSMLEGHPRPELLEVLPEPLRRRALDPPMHSEWVPEVHLIALTYAVADVLGMDDGELLTWLRERSRPLIVSPAFRLLLTFVSPEMILRYAGARWASWHCGSLLNATERGQGWVRLVLTFPPRLFDAVALKAYAEIFTLVLEHSRAPDPRVTLEFFGEEEASFLARWN